MNYCPNCVTKLNNANYCPNCGKRCICNNTNEYNATISTLFATSTTNPKFSN